jgi:hypothetical protein
MSKKKPKRKVYNKLKMDVSVSEKLQTNRMSLTANESIRKIKTNVLSKENRLGNNLLHMELVCFKLNLHKGKLNC